MHAVVIVVAIRTQCTTLAETIAVVIDTINHNVRSIQARVSVADTVWEDASIDGLKRATGSLFTALSALAVGVAKAALGHGGGRA